MAYKKFRGPYELDFVEDCGADPTGVADCGPAWALAFTKMSTLAAGNLLPLAQPKSFTLIVPPGVYLFSDPATVGPTWDFLLKASYVKIVGEPSASILKLALGPAGSLPAIANMFNLIVEGIAFLGANNTDLVSDVDGILNVNGKHGVLFDQCQFVNVSCQSLGVITQSRTRFRDCDWINCCAKNAAFGLIYALNADSVVLERTAISDEATFNGMPFAVNKVAVNVNQIHVNGPCDLVEIVDSFIDEGCAINVKVNGNAGRVRLFQIKGSTINPAVHLGATAMVQAEKVDHFIVDSWRMATGGSAVPLFDLINVTRTDLFALQPNGVLFLPIIQTATSCGLLKVNDSLAILPQGVSLAGVVTALYESNGIVSEYQTFNGNPIIGDDLVKIAGVGLIDRVGVADNVSMVKGAVVPIDSTASTAVLRVVKPGQTMTVSSDGTAAINVGDPIIPSTVTAGRVMKAAAVPGTPIIGRAISAQPGPGAFTIFFMPTVI